MCDMADEKNSKLSLLELKPCSRCGNPFMVPKGQKQDEALVCENCVKLEARKRELQIRVIDEVIEVENRMEESIKEMKNELTMTKGTFNKQFFLDKIKSRAQALTKSIELLENIEDSKDEKLVEEYKNLFQQMKHDST